MTVSRRDLLVLAASTVLLTGLGLTASVSGLMNSVYSSWPAVFGSMVGGPNILLVVALTLLVAGLPQSVAVGSRWTAHVRTRQNLTLWTITTAVRHTVIVGLSAGVAMLVWGCVVFGILADASPELVDAAGYGLTPDELEAFTASSYPLWAAAGGNATLFVLLSALWTGLHAGLLALMAVLSAWLVPSRVVAVLLPAVVLFGASVAAEVGVSASLSPMITWMHPGGLQPTSLGLAMIPGLVLAALCVALLFVVCRRAPTLQRFA